MKWREITLTTRKEQADLISDLFSQVGAAGVVVEDPELITEYIVSGLWDAHTINVPDIPPGMITLRAYLPTDETLEERLAKLQENLTGLEKTEHLPAHAWSLTDVDEEDWANAWKAFFKPEKVGERIVIRPSWEEYNSAQNDLVIDIDPGMAFGTGTHDTTVLCIRALEGIVKPGMTVVDVGTGSGVLSLAAGLLGADKVYAVDNDSVAVKVAKENVERNGLSDRVDVRMGDLMSVFQSNEEALKDVDVIVANIVADVILRLAPQAAQHLAPGKKFVASGIIQHRLEDVLEGLPGSGFEVEEILSRGDWAAVSAVRL